MKKLLSRSLALALAFSFATAPAMGQHPQNQPLVELLNAATPEDQAQAAAKQIEIPSLGTPLDRDLFQKLVIGKATESEIETWKAEKRKQLADLKTELDQEETQNVPVVERTALLKKRASIAFWVDIMAILISAQLPSNKWFLYPSLGIDVTGGLVYLALKSAWAKSNRKMIISDLKSLDLNDEILRVENSLDSIQSNVQASCLSVEDLDSKVSQITSLEAQILESEENLAKIKEKSLTLDKLENWQTAEESFVIADAIFDLSVAFFWIHMLKDAAQYKFKKSSGFQSYWSGWWQRFSHHFKVMWKHISSTKSYVTSDASIGSKLAHIGRVATSPIEFLGRLLYFEFWEMSYVLGKEYADYISPAYGKIYPALYVLSFFFNFTAIGLYVAVQSKEGKVEEAHDGVLLLQRNLDALKQRVELVKAIDKDPDLRQKLTCQ